MNENMKYYRTSVGTSLGQKLVRLMQDIEVCDSEAETFCSSIGVEVYLPAVEADFGGVGGLCMDAKTVNQRLFVPVCRMEGETFYMPRVQIKTVPMEAAKADALSGHHHILVSDEEMPFARVSMMFSRQQTAALAGMKLQYPSVADVLRRHRVRITDGAVIRRLVEGEPVHMVLPGCSETVALEVNASQEEDRRLMEAMSGRTFKMVSYLKGNRRAVELYRKMNSLKIVPQGTLAAMLGARDLNRRPGFFCCGDMFWVKSSLDLEHEWLEEVSSEEFLAAYQEVARKANG